MRRLFLVVALMLCASTVSVLAGAAVGVKIGTLGLGAEGTIGLGEKTNLRLGVNAASIDLSGLIEADDEDSAAEEIDLTIDLQTVSALFDWHIWGGGFRLTAGAMLNNNEVALSAEIGESIEIGDSTFTVSALDGSVAFGDVAPYLGIGVGNAVDQEGRLTFALDIGVMFQGSPEVEITATASDPTLQNSLNAELEKETQEIEDDVEGITLYPVISIGLAYSF